MIDRGDGVPIVLVPGVQGRWEWMRPAVSALASRARVVTGSLCGEPGSGCRLDPAAGFVSYVGQIDGWLARAGVARGAVCGVSLGGLIALRYAAVRPGRVTALILVSAPSPAWRPNRRQAAHVKAPLLTAPAFIARTPFTMLPEIVAAYPTWPRRVRFTMGHLWRVLAAPMGPSRMAARVRLAAREDFSADCARVSAPTLVVTGEPGLDRVVPVENTREYAAIIPGARTVTLPGTGHLGLVTRPEAFAEIVTRFVQDVSGSEVRRAVVKRVPAE